jgi:mRNA interferase RelE/StbE
LWNYRVRRFRIVYAIDRKTRVIRLMVVGHRRHVYEELSARLRRTTQLMRALKTARIQRE